MGSFQKWCFAIVLLSLISPSVTHPQQLQPMQQAAPFLPVVQLDIVRVDEDCCRRGRESTVCLPEAYKFVDQLDNDWNLYCKSKWIPCCHERKRIDACNKGVDVARQGGDCAQIPMDPNGFGEPAISCCMACGAGFRTVDQCLASDGTNLADHTFYRCCQEGQARRTAPTEKPEKPESEPEAAMLNTTERLSGLQNDLSSDKFEVIQTGGQVATATTGKEGELEATGSNLVPDVSPATPSDSVKAGDHETAGPIICPQHQVIDAETDKCIGE